MQFYRQGAVLKALIDYVDYSDYADDSVTSNLSQTLSILLH
jgi:hypothetical protein